MGPAQHVVGCGQVCHRTSRRRVHCAVTLRLRSKEPGGAAPAAWSRERPNPRQKPQRTRTSSRKSKSGCDRGDFTRQPNEAMTKCTGTRSRQPWWPTGRPGHRCSWRLLAFRREDVRKGQGHWRRRPQLTRHGITREVLSEMDAEDPDFLRRTPGPRGRGTELRAAAAGPRRELPPVARSRTDGRRGGSRPRPSNSV